ncbi:hypothetical protein OAJ79_04025 [Verrucomicrobia bacterium]|nr:hypothetical protein [Verrucomicrobiota bacterium]
MARCVTFLDEFNELDVAGLRKVALEAEEPVVLDSVHADRPTLRDFAHLISPAGASHLEALAGRSRSITQQRFGKTIRLFAPLYLSNECINNCSYCGFSRDNAILRG